MHNISFKFHYFNCFKHLDYLFYHWWYFWRANTKITVTQGHFPDRLRANTEPTTVSVYFNWSVLICNYQYWNLPTVPWHQESLLQLLRQLCFGCPDYPCGNCRQWHPVIPCSHCPHAGCARWHQSWNLRKLPPHPALPCRNGLLSSAQLRLPAFLKTCCSLNPDQIWNGPEKQCNRNIFLSTRGKYLHN